MSRLKNILILMLFFTAFIVPASASDFNRSFNNTDIARYNTSIHIYDQSATTAVEWIAILVIGIGLFLLSCILSMSQAANEIDAMISVLSWIPIGIAAYTARAIDMVTGYGVASEYSYPTPLNTQYDKFVLMESHTIYHFDLTAIFLWILWVVAVLNTIRIILNHRKLERMVQND